MLKKMLVATFLGLSLTLGGCGSLGVGPVHKDTATVAKEDPAKAILYGIDEFNAGVAALATAIVHDYNEGLYTQNEAKKYFDALNKAVLFVNQAENFVDLGNILKAKDRLDAANAALSLLQAELVKHKKENQ